MTTFRDASWQKIQEVRASLDEVIPTATTLRDAAQIFANAFSTFDSCVLARVFALIPFEQLPNQEQVWARSFAVSHNVTALLTPRTTILTLFGTAGIERSWLSREASQGHRAIPLVHEGFIEGAPMISALLGALQIDGVADADRRARTMTGGLNARFFVDDARTAKNAVGQHIIASREFVEAYAVKSVFGMGGTYVNGTRVVAIIFTNEQLTAQEVDRFASFIGTFKLATTASVERGRLF
ncbi:MAG: hypothetical protein QM831_22165 [Kofleriaceae bacterium]